MVVFCWRLVGSLGSRSNITAFFYAHSVNTGLFPGATLSKDERNVILS